MSVGSNSVITSVHSGGNINLLSGAALEENLKASTALYDLVSVGAGEVAPHVASVPQTDYHVRVELENGTDRYLSFDAHFIRETDEATGDDVEYYDLYNLHLDGRPCTADDVDGLFDGGMERLGNWVWQQGEVCE
jgi:hypothetical protein